MTVIVGFGVVAACVLLAAIFVVRSQNLVHATLWLGATLAGTAVVYVMLGATFLAGVQVLLYVGGVMTLMVFGVMLTRRHDGIIVRAERTSSLRGALAAAALFGVLAAAVARTDLPTQAVAAPGTKALGAALVTQSVLAFEVLSLLLLGSIIAAVVIARRRDPGAPAVTASPVHPSAAPIAQSVPPVTEEGGAS